MRSLALKAIPYEDGYKHQEGNSAAHVKASLMGCSQHVIIKEGLATMEKAQIRFYRSGQD